jgi:hypothetical protein
MSEDQDSARALVRAIEALTAETRTAAAYSRIALSALARLSPELRDQVEVALDAEALDRRAAGSPRDLEAAQAMASLRADLAPGKTPLTVDGEALERVLIAAARGV